MAAAVPQLKPAQSPTVEDPQIKHMQRLVARGLVDLNQHKSRIADCIKYSMPWRHRFDANQHVPDLDVIYDSTISTVQEDFAADMLNTFTPQKNNWLVEQPVASLDSGTANIIKKPLAERQRIVFSEMARSSMYQALQEAYLDLAIGTMVLVANDYAPSKPIHVEAIPSTDAILVRGPFGTVDTFRRKTYLRSEVKVLWPAGEFSVLGDEPKDGADPECEVTDGCWRDWTDLSDEVYHYLVEAKGRRLYYKKYTGAGSCPFIVARWSRDSTTAQGIGPTYRMLPDIKTLNHFAFLGLKNYDKHVDPVTSYEDDGVINIDNGIDPGTWVPRAAGSDAPQVIESKGRFDVQAFEIEEKRSAIKRAHYQDRPEQLGKTPPTAFQWADERAERARRMGTPATNLVLELQYPLYRRFVYLLDQRGVLPKITADGKADGELVALEPISPLLRAQEQEEVIRLERFADMLVTKFGPQIAMVIIDVIKYAHRLAELLGIDEKLLRKEADIEAAIKQLLPVLQATGSVPGGSPDIPVEAIAGQL